MKKIILYSIALASYNSLCLAAATSTTTTKQIQGQSIQFNCIPELDAITSQIPLIITTSTMDLTNACNTLTDAAQAYEDAADQSSNLQMQGDFYYNAAQAYLTACNLVLITTENIGAIGDIQDITYIQSYRCSALQAFNQSFESYLSLCLQNQNSSASAMLAANATLALSDFLVNLINLNKQQLYLLSALNQSSPDFSTFMQSYKPSSSCNPACWYPVQLPGEDTASCQWKKINLPANPTDYSGFLSALNNSTYTLRSYFGFDTNTATTIMQTLGTPGQIILNEGPANTGPKSHNQGLLSSPTAQGSYIANSATGSIQNPLYDMGDALPSLGNILLSFIQILDPYSSLDPRADANNSAYDENFANLINIIPQPQYIFTTPAPTMVQNLHDTIRDYMYSADINKMDSYAYNAYANITAKPTYPADVLPALSKMNNARMNVVECYEGAILKIVTGLTGKTSAAPTLWKNLTGNDQKNAITAAKCMVIILPMFNAIFEQIKNYDLPLLSALSSQASTKSTVSTAPIEQTEASVKAIQDSIQQAITNAQTTAYQKAVNLITFNVQQINSLKTQGQHLLDLATGSINAGKAIIAAVKTVVPTQRLWSDLQINPNNNLQGLSGYAPLDNLQTSIQEITNLMQLRGDPIVGEAQEILNKFQPDTTFPNDANQKTLNAIKWAKNIEPMQQNYIDIVITPVMNDFQKILETVQQAFANLQISINNVQSNSMQHFDTTPITNAYANFQTVLNTINSDPIVTQNFKIQAQQSITNAQQIENDFNTAMAAANQTAANQAALDQAAAKKTATAISTFQTAAQKAQAIQISNQQTAMQAALNQLYNTTPTPTATPTTTTPAPSQTQTPVQTAAPAQTSAQIKASAPSTVQTPVQAQAPKQISTPVSTPVKTPAATPTPAPAQNPVQTTAPAQVQAPVQKSTPLVQNIIAELYEKYEETHGQNN